MPLIDQYQHIVVAWDDFNSLGIIRTLGEYGISPDVILLSGGKLHVVESCKYCKTITLVNDEKEVVSALFEIKSENGKKAFVHTGCDVFENALDYNYEELKDDFYFYNAGSRGRVSEYMRKDAITELAGSCGLCVPKSEMLKKGELPQLLLYPVFSKTASPLMDGWKKDVHIYYTQDDILKAYEKFVSAESLFQEYIEKEYDYTLQGVSINAGEKIHIAYMNKYLRSSDVSFGAYLEFSPFDDGELLEKIRIMFSQIGYSGVFGIDMLKGKDGNDYFLEVNFRNDEINYGCNYGHYPYPIIWAESILAGELVLPNAVRKKSFTAMNEFADIKCAKEVGCLKWFKQFLTADVHYLSNKRDLRPFPRFLIAKLIKK